MAFNVTHELHRRRFGRNLGVGVLLLLFVGLVYALTVVKVTRGEPMQGYDHIVQPEAQPVTLAPATAAPEAAQ